MSAIPARQRQETQLRTPSVSLTGLLAEPLAAIPEDERELAGRALIVPRLSACGEELTDLFSTVPGAVGFLVLEGIVLKETTLSTWSALELLNVGDVLAPPLTRHHQDEARAVSRYLAHGSVSLGVLGVRFRAASRRWPALAGDLHTRLARQTHRASAHLAMLHASRVEQRLLLLFRDLGERCGRMTGTGVAIDIDLTHELIGRLVGAQRPTISLALRNLAEEGWLRRTRKGHWLMAPGDRPLD